MRLEGVSGLGNQTMSLVHVIEALVLMGTRSINRILQVYLHITPLSV